MRQNRDIEPIYEDAAQELYDPIEEDPLDDIERKEMKRLYRQMENLRRKFKQYNR